MKRLSVILAVAFGCVVIAGFVGLFTQNNRAAQQTINVGVTNNDGTGDTLRTAFQKVNSNTTEVYQSFTNLGGTNLSFLLRATNGNGVGLSLTGITTNNSVFTIITNAGTFTQVGAQTNTGALGVSNTFLVSGASTHVGAVTNVSTTTLTGNVDTAGNVRMGGTNDPYALSRVTSIATMTGGRDRFYWIGTNNLDIVELQIGVAGTIRTNTFASTYAVGGGYIPLAFSARQTPEDFFLDTSGGTHVRRLQMTVNTNATAGLGATGNAQAGQNVMASAAATLILTNSGFTSASIIVATLGTADATGLNVKSVAAGSGVATITVVANNTGTPTVNWVWLNPP